MGNMYWIYVGQIACEKGIALAGGVYWGGFICASLLTQKIVSAIGSYFMFYGYGALSAIGFFVFIFTIKETQGLLKEDIEQLYVPEDLQTANRHSINEEDED